MLQDKGGRASAVTTPLMPLVAFTWRLLLALMAARVLLVAWQAERVTDAGMLAPVLLQGLRFDLVFAGLALVVPVLLFPLLASNERLFPAWRAIIRWYLPAALLFAVFMECGTPSFIDQYDARPNILFVEYLEHPKEVSATLWAAYKLPLLAAAVILSALGTMLFRRFGRIARAAAPAGVVRAIALTPVLLMLCTGMIRSTLDHRPVNPSTVALSTDSMVNDLALNSAYTLLYALYETRHETEGGFRYATMSDEETIRTVRREMHVADGDFVDPAMPTLHHQQASSATSRPLNLVIIIEESLGAEFVGSLGGLPLTPNLDALGREGLWFEQLFATGTRSVRGLEALVTGFTPTPARSVVKLGKAQKDFFTLAELLAAQGFKTSFIYGGEAQFDNMRRFFMNNGFQSVIDEKDYESPVFTGSWGVSDEDLFQRAHEEFSRDHERPFFTLVFTSSNHSPFEFPDGRIELYDPEKQTVNNAVKYADFALGKFFELARASNYWNDTVFLVVADHNSRVYGNEVIPVARFHVPGVILGGTIKPAVFSPVASQIDLPPTLLSMIGVSAEHPMIGRDLTDANAFGEPGRAIMQFNDIQAYMEGNHVAVLQKDLPVSHFLVEQGHLVQSDTRDTELERKAIAHATWSSLAYERALYRLP